MQRFWIVPLATNPFDRHLPEPGLFAATWTELHCSGGPPDLQRQVVAFAAGFSERADGTYLVLAFDPQASSPWQALLFKLSWRAQARPQTALLSRAPLDNDDVPF